MCCSWKKNAHLKGESKRTIFSLDSCRFSIQSLEFVFQPEISTGTPVLHIKIFKIGAWCNVNFHTLQHRELHQMLCSLLEQLVLIAVTNAEIKCHWTAACSFSDQSLLALVLLLCALLLCVISQKKRGCLAARPEMVYLQQLSPVSCTKDVCSELLSFHIFN